MTESEQIKILSKTVSMTKQRRSNQAWFLNTLYKEAKREKRNISETEKNTDWKKADDSDKREIKITYKKEEAEVMKKMYEDMIEEVENQILYADVGDVAELNEKLTNLVQEYQTFISYNTNTNELLQNV